MTRNYLTFCTMFISTNHRLLRILVICPLCMCIQCMKGVEGAEKECAWNVTNGVMLRVLFCMRHNARIALP
jgi:hypothetical protein